MLSGSGECMMSTDERRRTHRHITIQPSVQVGVGLYRGGGCISDSSKNGVEKPKVFGTEQDTLNYACGETYDHHFQSPSIYWACKQNIKKYLVYRCLS